MQNDKAWFATEQRQKMNAGTKHMEAMQSHMSAANNSISAQDHDGASYHLGAAATHGMAASDHYAKHSKHWIQDAIKKPGSFTKAAKRAHKTVSAYASSVKTNPSKHSSTMVKRANLAQTLGKMRKGK